MKTPIRHEETFCADSEGFGDCIKDVDGKDIPFYQVCDAVNNAAAGAREKGPVPDGEKEGDLLLLLGKSPEDTEILMWSGGCWNVSFGDFWEPIDTEQISQESWAHINFLKQQEATK